MAARGPQTAGSRGTGRAARAGGGRRRRRGREEALLGFEDLSGRVICGLCLVVDGAQQCAAAASATRAAAPMVAARCSRQARRIAWVAVCVRSFLARAAVLGMVQPQQPCSPMPIDAMAQQQLRASL